MRKIIITLIFLGLYGNYTNASIEESHNEQQADDVSVSLESEVSWARGGRNHGGNGRHGGWNGRGHRNHGGDWGYDNSEGPRPGFYEKYGRGDYVYSGQPTY